MAAFLIDISRTIARTPYSHPTGIDRVERAYIAHFLQSDSPVWFISRVLKGYVVLDKAAMQVVWSMINGEQPWQKPDLIALLFSQKMHKVVNRAESTLRRLSKGQCWQRGLGKMLVQNLPKDFVYLNIGHANRKPFFWQAMRAAGAGKMFAMVHDVIPLDYPEYCAETAARRFASELKSTAKACDGLIYNSADTATRTEIWLKKWGLDPASATILLGVEPLPRPKAKPPASPVEFVTLGTIEPRKNHQLLLDIWPDINGHLHIIGARGWLNKTVFETLDTSPMIGKTVFEHINLTDAALAEHLSSARALLFPSFAEGFGYPLVEALQMGLPVICSDLACFRELAGDLPTYLPPDDPEAWRAAINAAAATPREKIPENVSFPTWEQHFAELEAYVKQADQRKAGT